MRIFCQKSEHMSELLITQLLVLRQLLKSHRTVQPVTCNAKWRQRMRTSGVKSGLVVNFWSFFSKASFSLSLSNLSSFSMKLASPSCFLASSQVGVFCKTVMTPDRVNSTSAGGLAYAYTPTLTQCIAGSKSTCTVNALQIHAQGMAFAG